eukprot:CAMPEP_0196822452 /NCGR_PEP_ID=MMETSP1362-20130617/83561_1 /TAXON_ID=163516 /ORGANISM="Leptocylindrus danicus, Strain CCMP1856" /LENGTH=317 /DNA_ID=CAMNT_0042202015 /DNA_START=131 /DNA_END=1084 /DNA_ORIENTATION=+
MASSSYNAYNYDMTTPLFTPDGRLLQVEYASLAAERSPPLVALSVTDREEGHAIILAAFRQPGSSSTAAAASRQKRIISLPNCPRIALAMSGVLSDAVDLLSVVRQHVDSWQRTYGVKETAIDNVAGIATVIGDACQSHAFGGGLRPYGASFIVCGVNDDGNGLSLSKTDPSGAVVQLQSTAEVDRNKDGRKPYIIFMGNDGIQKEKIQRKISDILGGIEDATIRDSVEAIIEAMLINDDATIHNGADSSTSGSSIDGEFPKDIQSKHGFPEIVIVSRKGVQEVDEETLSVLERRIMERSSLTNNDKLIDKTDRAPT